MVAPIRSQVTSVKETVIGMGEYAVSASVEAVLTCIGLGSCIALCIYDGLARIGGMAHVVLPVHDGAAAASPARFADTSVPFLVGQVIRHGGSRQHLLAKIAGGAQMTLARGLRDTFKTGERNLAGIKAALAREGIELVAADVGGTMGRTVKLYVATGKLMVRTVGGDTKEL